MQETTSTSASTSAKFKNIFFRYWCYSLSIEYYDSESNQKYYVRTPQKQIHKLQSITPQLNLSNTSTTCVNSRGIKCGLKPYYKDLLIFALIKPISQVRQCFFQNQKQGSFVINPIKKGFFLLNQKLIIHQEKIAQITIMGIIRFLNCSNCSL